MHRIFERGRRVVGTKRQGLGAQPLDFFAELRAKSIGYQYRLANLTNFEKVHDS